MKRQISLAIMLTLLAVACNHWPPFAKEERAIFEDNRKWLEKLRIELEKTDLVDVNLNRHRDGLNGRKSFEVSPEQVDVSNEKIIVSCFKELSIITSFWRKDGITYFVHSFTRDDETFYRLNFAHSSDKTNRPPTCVEDMKNSPCGICAVPLNDGWWIDYKWHPSDLTVAKQKCAGE